MRTFTPEEMKGTLIHEYGHHLFNRVFVTDRDMPANVQSAYDDFERIWTELRNDEVFYNQHFRTGTSINECFAEMHRMYYTDSDNFDIIADRLRERGFDILMVLERIINM